MWNSNFCTLLTGGCFEFSHDFGVCQPICSVSTVVFSVQQLFWLLFVLLFSQSYLTLCSPMDCSTLGFPVLQHLPESAQTPVHWLVMSSNHLILCGPLLLLASIFPSIRIFPNESALCIRWPKYWRFSFNISPSNEHSGLISFRMDWFDIAVQGTLKSLLQHQSSKALILQCSAFFTVQLSHSYVTTRKTIALTRPTFVGQVMSLLFNMLRGWS